jgi:hypothetical protein
MPHVKTVGSKRLLELARSVPFFAGDDIDVTFRPGHGYYLSRNGAAFAWFRYERVGVHWLNDLKATGQPNFANLRNGTAYQRGVFQNAPECPHNAKIPTPWDDFWESAEKRRDEYFFGESRAFTLTNEGLQMCMLLSYWDGKEAQ